MGKVRYNYCFLSFIEILILKQRPKMLKVFIYSLFLFALLSIVACGEKTSSETNNASHSSDSTAADTPKSYCFYSEGLTNVSMNLRIKGNEIRGFAEYVTPKAGMELYSNYNISGTIEDGLYKMNFTRTDSEDKQGLGEQFTENWKIEDGQLIPMDASLVEQLKAVTCSENALFSQEIQQLQAKENSYSYEGKIGKNMNIKLFLTSKTNPKDAQEELLTGHYYYSSQGPEKTIQLEGVRSQQGMQPAFLYETKEGQTFGKFVIEQDIDLSQAFEALWVSADGEKEYPVQLQPQ